MSKHKVPSTPVPIDESSLAWKMFDAFVSKNQISVTRAELIEYASKELNISTDKLPPGLIKDLPLVLVALMNIWSGCHLKGEFLGGKLKKIYYFQQFQKFMTNRMNITVHEHYSSAVKALGDTRNLESEGKRDEEFSPFSISIKCPAHMLNTIVFSNLGDDVIMQQHLGTTWKDLTLTQLLNWPHILVSFCTQDLYFVRRQATEFVRYLNFLPHESYKCGENIENVIIMGQQECYSQSYLEEYIKDYLKALKKTSRISRSRLSEIQTILEQFWEDIKHIDVNKSMVTNTIVEFRLSSVPFIRNKILKSAAKEAEETRVGYCEVITPKVKLLLGYFKPQQLDTPNISFDYREKVTKDPNNWIAIPKITYKCTFCQVEYQNQSAKNDIMEHLKSEHKMEQHVRCTVCKKQFDVLNLSACRWRHKCVPKMV